MSEEDAQGIDDLAYQRHAQQEMRGTFGAHQAAQQYANRMIRRGLAVGFSAGFLAGIGVASAIIKLVFGV